MFTTQFNRFSLVFRWSRRGILAAGIAVQSIQGDAADPHCAAPVDWTVLPSTYTHDMLGNQVDQYARGVEPTSNERPDFERSGFRHTRSTIQAGNSTDHFHVVERWGPPVQPYGEWRYPYRPFSVPYDAWGPQPPLVNAPQNNAWNFGNPGFAPGRPPMGHPGMPNPAAGMMNPPNGPAGMPPFNGWGGQHPGAFAPNGWGYGQGWGQGMGNFGFGVGPNNALRPEQDEFYPAPQEPPMSDRDFFFAPNRP